MRDRRNAPLFMAGMPLVATGCAFLAVGAAGQSAFAYAGAGLLAPGIVLIALAWRRSRNA